VEVTPKTMEESVAGNGLLHRRIFLAQAGALLGVGTIGMLDSGAVQAQNIQGRPPWMLAPGKGVGAYGTRARFEAHVQRAAGSAPGMTGSGASRTPLQHLQGIITPNSLHFERHHSGIPEINPDEHRFLIHGLVDRPLVFDMDMLSRYPMISKIHFIECSGNSRVAGLIDEPVDQNCGVLHGLVSCSEWTGVPLSILLDEAGVDPNAGWILAEGSDAAAMSRSVPMAKAMDDAMIAIYQNGERLRPDNGYPMRLFLPGFEGNTSVKWLRRIKVTAEPTMTRDETSKYTDLMADGTSLMFTYPMAVKSVITSPSPGLDLNEPGVYEISGLAWSGGGRISRVEVSADGGLTWGEAALSGPVLDRALTRFRMAWRWNGAPAVIMSRAIDDTGAIQPTRDSIIAEKGMNFAYHYNGIQLWAIDAEGRAVNTYA
jgi:sulfane dehydrogenase subunit SoxC